MSLANKALLLTIVPLLFVVGMLVVISALLHQYEDEVRRSDHSKAVISHTTAVIQSLNDVGFAFIVYDAATKAMFEGDYIEKVDVLRKNFKSLHHLVRHNAAHEVLVKNAMVETEEALKVLESRKKELDAGGRLVLPEALELEGEMNRMVKDLDTIIADEKKAQELHATKNTRGTLTVSIALTFLAIVIMVPAAIIYNRANLKRFNILMENSRRLAQGQMLQRLDGADELAEIDRVFHDAAYKLTEAARKERAVIDNAADLICSIDLNGVFAAVSPSAEKLWGYAPDELIGSNWMELIHPEDANRVTTWFRSLASTKSGDGETDTRVVRKNGVLMDMRWSAHWAPEERLMFCVAHDITERQELERFKQQFIAMISHDLRTPLTAVKSTLELLGEGTWGELSEKAQDKIARAEGNLKHTIELINNLIDLEKMQSGKIELTLGDVPLAALVQRCTSVVAPLAESRSIILATAYSDLVLKADEQRLAQVVINLLGNAIKFSPPDSRVAIVIDKKASHVQIAINDQGPGIPADLREKIFERYHQIPGEMKQAGSGLGLTISKAIVEAHGGEIGVTAVDGKGSSFWFTIPA